MALTDNPYLPLYVKDWMTSNKLKLCSANAHGVMINVMCLMHRENEYGKILLKQNFKQTDNQILNFATLLAKLLPFSEKEIIAGLTELVDEKCLLIETDTLICERMVNDALLSEIRKNAGSKGGDKTAKRFAIPKRKAKPAANTGIGNGTDNGSDLKKESPPEFVKAWNDYSEMRKKIKRPMTPRAEELAKSELRNLAGKDVSLAVKILEQSTFNSWQGLFALKTTSSFEKKPDQTLSKLKYETGNGN